MRVTKFALFTKVFAIYDLQPYLFQNPLPVRSPAKIARVPPNPKSAQIFKLSPSYEVHLPPRRDSSMA